MSAVQHPGERSLSTLLSTLTTTLHPTTYVFTTIRDPSKLPPLSEMQMFFREADSKDMSVIIRKEYAIEHGVEYSFPCRMITLNVTSSLEAVGFIAVIATRLAEKDMGVNPVSGFYHDHLFVPEGREGDAIEEMKALAEEEKEKLNQ